MLRRAQAQPSGWIAWTYSTYDNITTHTQRPKAVSATTLCLNRSLSVAVGQAMRIGSGQTGHIPQNISMGVQHRLTQGRRKLGYKVVCGHMQPRTEMRPTRPSEPADTAGSCPCTTLC
jgi:hypothetical protein